LAANTYTFTVTNSSSCTSGASASAVITAVPGSPNAPVTTVTQPTCSVATGIITVTVQTAGETYSFDNGVTFQSGNIKSGLAAGSYNVMIKSTGGCISPATLTTINAVPAPPAAPIVGTITQPTCAIATGSVVLSSLPTGNWTLNPGNINGSTTNTTISGLVAGTYNYSVTNSVGCISTASANVVITAVQGSPNAPVTTVTQPTCSLATGTITVTVQTAGETYSFDNGVTFQS